MTNRRAIGSGATVKRPEFSSPYNCPRHNVALVARVLSTYKHDGSYAQKQVRYFACPIAGCTYMKPDKWQKRKRYV